MNKMMKKLLMLVAVGILATAPVCAQTNPAGIRLDICSAETDKSEYSLFTYKDSDDDASTCFYLSLGRVTSPLGVFRDDFPEISINDIRETCITLGATADEAFATLDSILVLFDKDVETTASFSGRASTGSERLGDPCTTTCVVKKKPLGGKRLLFQFVSGDRQAEAYLTKAIVKELRAGLKIDKKLHPKRYK